MRPTAKLSMLAVAIAVAVALLATSCHPGNSLICNGGTRQVGNACFCPLGTAWDGGFCVGTPQAGTCTGGAYQVESQCFCPDGTFWQNDQCQAIPQCAGGAYAGNDGQCYCPAGTQWDGGQCAAVNYYPPADPSPPQPQPYQDPSPPPTTYEDLCYDLDCNGERTGKQCFDNRADYCASLCASDNCLAPMACERNCR